MPDNIPKWEETQPLDVPRFEDTAPVEPAPPSFDQTSEVTVKDEIRAAIPEIVQQIRNAIIPAPKLAEFTPEQIQSTIPPAPGPLQAAVGAVDRQIGAVAPSLPGPEALKTAGELVYNPEDPLGLKGMSELGQAARLKGSGIQVSPAEEKALHDFTVENFKGIVLYPAAISVAAQGVGWYLRNYTLPGAVKSAREAITKGLIKNGVPPAEAPAMADAGLTQAVAKAQAGGAEVGTPEFVAIRKAAEKGFGPKEGTPNVPAVAGPVQAAAPDANIQALSARLDQPIPKFEETQPAAAAPKTFTRNELRDEDIALRAEAAKEGLQARPTAPIEGWKQEVLPTGEINLESPTGYRILVPKGQDPAQAAAAIREVEKVEYGASEIPDFASTTPAPVKEPWQMTRKEAIARGGFSQVKDLTPEQLAQVSKNDGVPADDIKKNFDSWVVDLKTMKMRGEDAPVALENYSDVKQALSEGKPVPPEVLKDYPELAGKAETPFTSSTEKYKKEMEPLYGQRITDEQGTWELTGNNDKGLPYFSKVRGNKVLKKQYVIEGYDQRWVAQELDKRRENSPSGPTRAKEISLAKPMEPTPESAPQQPRTLSEAIKDFGFPEDSQVSKDMRLYRVVDLFKSMEGGVPAVVKRFRRPGVLGTASNTGKIKLNRLLGMNEEMASLVLSHEISHVADALYGDTTQTYARGNILGRIGAMDRYIYENLKNSVMERGEMVQKMKGLRAETLSRVSGEATVQGLKGKARAEYIRDNIKAATDEAFAAQGFISKKDITEELVPLAKWWNSSDIKITKSEELYAEAMSVMILSPKDLAARAPKFYSAVSKWLSKKPEFEQSLNEFWANLEKRPEVAQDKVLDDLIGNFQTHRDTRAKAEEKVMAAKQDVAPLDWLAMKMNYTIPLTNKMARMGLQPWDTPFNEIQMWKHRAPIAEKYLRDINDTIREAIIGSKNLNEDLVGAQLALNRIAYGDRSELLNTLGITETSAKEISERIKERAGDEYDKLQEIIERAYDSHGSILDGGDGVLNAEGLKKLRDNRYYATYSLNKFIEESAGGNGEISKLIHPQIGSLEAIGNPLEALIDKDLNLQYAFLRSKAFQAFHDWGMKLNDGTVLPAERTAGGNFKGAPAGYKPLYWLWDSKVQAMYVKDGFYQIFKQDHSEAARHAAVAESALKFFKYAFVNLNPGFFVTNPIRDSFFTAQNLKELPFFSMDQRYKFGALESLARTLKELPASVRHQMGKETSAAIQELKALGVGQSEYNRDMGELSKGLERLLRSNGIFTRDAKFSGPGQALLRAMEIALDVGRASDMASKVAALKLLKEKHPDADPAWLSHILRTRAGTPDTTNRGALTGLYNWVFMYSQVAFEGWRGNYAAAKENPAAFTAKMFGQAILPRLLILAAGAGFIGRDEDEREEMKQVVDGIPEWFKAGSLVIPIGRDANGKSVFMSIPQDEFSRTAGGAAYFMVKNMTKENRDSLLKDTLESMKMAVDYGQTQAPGLNPIIQLGFQAQALSDLPKGEGPKDSFGRPMIPARYQAEYQHQKGRALTAYLKNVWNFAGLNSLYKFKPGPKEVQSDLEDLLQIPIVGGMAGRLIRVSASGATTNAFEAKQEATAARAATSNDRIDRMLELRNEFVKENKVEPAPRDVYRFYQQMAKEMPEAMKGVSIADFRRSFAAYTVGAKGAEGKVQAVFKSGSNEAKAAALEQLSKEMDPEALRRVIKQARRDKMLSPKAIQLFRRAQKKTD